MASGISGSGPRSRARARTIRAAGAGSCGASDHAFRSLRLQDVSARLAPRPVPDRVRCALPRHGVSEGALDQLWMARGLHPEGDRPPGVRLVRGVSPARRRPSRLPLRPADLRDRARAGRRTLLRHLHASGRRRRLPLAGEHRARRVQRARGVVLDLAAAHAAALLLRLRWRRARPRRRPRPRACAAPPGGGWTRVGAGRPAGRVLWAGPSPDRYPPTAAELVPLRDETIHPRINRPTKPTVYPPGAQAAFALVALVSPNNLPAWRVFLLSSEILTMGLLLVLLQRAGVTQAAVIVYAWSPLVVFEGVQAGHVDLARSEEHTSELQSLTNLVCRLLLEKKNDMNRRLRHVEGASSCT